MNDQRLLTLANLSMVVFLLLFCGSLGTAWLGEQSLSMGTTVFMHISLVITAALFKLAYVVRLIAQDRMGQPLV
ncbi:hypothetical protein GU3_12175 [Oceanimonas sp. GK1]|uniref:hypothetical protein n=1 Tax=Oceanimonas sp. (strain GK1 / IBRC-M 10197) TaxID=511062 RepID=UPI0002494FB1|nr:hypothetical protein [Oceanimonas sp. GK1]AEY02190.1 hypothetical protein GU3_12175 [Oceanimonas sp. GK1]